MAGQAFNVGDFNARLRAFTGQVRDEAALALRDAAEYVLGEAVAIVPHEYGDLQNSGQTSVDAAELRAVISFDTPYARVQHEDLTFQHDGGRRAKYLEGPLTSSGPQVEKIIQRRVGRAFGTGA